MARFPVQRAIDADHVFCGLLSEQLLEKDVFIHTFSRSKHIAVVQRGYEQSLMAIGYLHRIGSKRQFRTFLGLVGRGVDSDNALRQVYRFDVETMLKRAALRR